MAIRNPQKPSTSQKPSASCAQGKPLTFMPKAPATKVGGRSNVEMTVSADRQRLVAAAMRVLTSS